MKLPNRYRVMPFIILLAVAFALAMLALIAFSVNAMAGIGPSGFAFYAKQGIVNENNAVYGKGNSPWIVTCSEIPDFRRLTDVITCHVRIKT